jgi:hypothetical protein
VAPFARACEAVDRPGLVRRQRLFHLHGLQDHDQVTGLHLLAVGDLDLDDGALHGGGQGIPEAALAAFFAARLRAAGAEPASGSPGPGRPAG